jgi:hypothetical protein
MINVTAMVGDNDNQNVNTFKHFAARPAPRIP